MVLLCPVYFVQSHEPNFTLLAPVSMKLAYDRNVKLGLYDGVWSTKRNILRALFLDNISHIAEMTQILPPPQ